MPSVVEPTKYTGDIPGPISTASAQKLHAIFDARAVHFITDYKKSKGNYIVDVDGNEYLDVYAQVASIPVGYNNETLIQGAKSPEMIEALVNRPAIGNFPSDQWIHHLREGLMKVAPKGHTNIFTAQSGSEANELAFKAACMLYRRRQRGDRDWSEEEITSCLNNEKPGSPDLAILSFRNSFHGRGFGSLSTTRSKAVHKLDIPSFNWPQADFPALKYPLEKYAKENAAEEKRCLEKVEHLITSWHCPVVGLIVEPIQSEGGDNHASNEFFQAIRDITAKHGVTFIVDEVQTGFGGTGSFWAHDHWNLSTPADMVTFSKKAQTAGYYFSNRDLLPDKAFRQFNTWIGDPARVVLCNYVIKEILEKNLIEQTARVGDKLYAELDKLQAQYPNHMWNLRGKNRGTFLAFDTKDPGSFVKAMRQNGVNIGVCGTQSVRLRPMLCFEEKHVDILVSALNKVLSSL